ncbi:hypothetical protein ABVT39_007474 [Epinephelus coioides]
MHFTHDGAMDTRRTAADECGAQGGAQPRQLPAYLQGYEVSLPQSLMPHTSPLKDDTAVDEATQWDVALHASNLPKQLNLCVGPLSPSPSEQSYCRPTTVKASENAATTQVDLILLCHINRHNTL